MQTSKTIYLDFYAHSFNRCNFKDLSQFISAFALNGKVNSRQNLDYYECQLIFPAKSTLIFLFQLEMTMNKRIE